MKDSDHRKKLISLGAETLADSLLDLASYSDSAHEVVERLLATTKENEHRFMQKLARTTEGYGFVGRRASAGYARELIMMLDDLKAGVEDPLQGLSLMTVFYESDEYILGHCDDSNGNVGDVFRYEAVNLFAHFAKACTEKKKIARLILRLNEKDDYGIRDNLVYKAGELLPQDMLRWMIEKLQEMNQEDSENYHIPHLIESLARQTGDAKLFEKTRLASWNNINAAAIVDIARVYYETGDTDTALEWLGKIPPEDNFHTYERDRLFEDIYRSRGETDHLTDLLTEKFRSHPSVENLDKLINIIGEDNRESIVADAVKNIMANPNLDEGSLQFLLALELLDEAETYLLDRAEKIDGYSYYFWPPIAQVMKDSGRTLAATLIYRTLLESILDRAYTKAYHYGVDYLKALDSLSVSIDDWKGFPSHRDFWLGLKEKHGRKRSFWGKYNKGGY